MTKEAMQKEPDSHLLYADIIDLPHHQSDRRPHMSLYDRAAQFSPFAALSGYDEMIDEEARVVDHRIELSEDELSRLNQILAQIAEGSDAEMSITWFVPDLLKAGGRYETIVEKVRKVDAAAQKVILCKKNGVSGSYMEIPIADILDIYLVNSVINRKPFRKTGRAE